MSKILMGVDGMTDMDYVRIIRDLRQDADKTQTQIADVLGTSQTMYARYERGANELPIHHLLSLSKYYGVSSDYILGLSNKDNATR
jgi:transcriptional regulator with XRE-family HTH domain